MRRTAIGLLCLGFVDLGIATAAPIAQLSENTNITVVTDVDRSEWTPSMILTLQTKSGEYAVESPAGAWSSAINRPATGRGLLTAIELQRVRQAVLNIIKTWNDGHGDEKHGTCQRPVSNAGLAHLKISWGTHVLSSTGCWTPAEFKFRRLIDEYFDFKFP